MKLLKKIIATAITGLFLLVASPVFPFDKEPGKFKEFNDPEKFVDVSTTITRVITFGTAEGLAPDIEKYPVEIVTAVGVFGQEGSCFYIGSNSRGHFFATAAHVVMPAEIKIQMSTYSFFVTKPIRIIDQTIFIGQGTGLGSATAEIVWVDTETDIAVLRLKGNWMALEDLGYRPVWTFNTLGDKLHEGDAIATIVAVRDEDGSKLWHFEVRYGKVVHNHPEFPGTFPRVPYLAWFSMSDISSDVLVYPGDSGSPVFAWDNGQPVIVGIARAVIQFQDPYTGEYCYMSYFVRIDQVTKLMLEK